METSFDNLNDEQLISLYNALKVQRQEYKEDIEASEQRLSERGLFYLDKKELESDIAYDKHEIMIIDSKIKAICKCAKIRGIELEPENEPRKILKKISN